MNFVIGVAFNVMILGRLLEALALLPSPQNVTLQTLNTRYVLTWTWSAQTGCPGNQSAVFTAQYLPKYKQKLKKKSWVSVCSETSDVYCDFTGCELHYLGMYLLRLQASCAGAKSKWVQLEFCPDKQAHLGPPSKVEATPGPGLLGIRITDPLTSRNTSMKEFYPELYYIIMYWKDSPNTVKDYQFLSTKITMVCLSDLEPWTVYCLRAQSKYDFYNKTSSFSETQCQRTSGRTPLWQILLWFLASLVLCFLCVLLPSYGLLRFYWLLKSTFFPSCRLPENMQEYLYDSSPDSDRPRLLTPESELEVCCETLDVCPVVVCPEIHVHPDPPCAPDPDLDPARHSRQGSGDSGVYSEEGSGQAAGGVGPEKAAGPEKGAEQVKMMDIGADSRTERPGSALCGRVLKHKPSRPSIWAAEDILEECV